MDVLLVFEEKVIHQLLHLMGIAIVDGCPCFLYDLVDLNSVGSVSAWLVGCVGVGWSLDCLHWLCALLFDNPVDGCLCLWPLESLLAALPGSLCDVMFQLAQVALVCLMQSSDLQA